MIFAFIFFTQKYHNSLKCFVTDFDLNVLFCFDWEDPEDVARRERVDDYNFDLLEDLEPMVFVPGGNPSGSDWRDEYVNYLDDGNDSRVPDDDSIVDSERKAWREYCASIYRKRFRPMGVRRDELLADESNCEDTYHVAGRQYFDVPDGMDLMRPTAHRLSRSEITVDVETRPHVDNDPNDPDQVDIGCDVRSLPDAVPAVFDMAAAVPLALPVIVETGPQVGCYSDLVLSGGDMEMDDTDVNRDSATVPLSWPVVVDTETQVDVRWETTSAVVPFGDGCGRPAGWLDSEDVCDVPDEFPVGIEVAAVEPLCFHVVVQTRPQVGCDPALPVYNIRGRSH